MTTPGLPTVSSPPSMWLQAGQEGYLNVFQTELEAFKGRVKEYSVKPLGVDMPKDGGLQGVAPRGRLDPREVLESLPPVRWRSSLALFSAIGRSTLTLNREPLEFGSHKKAQRAFKWFNVYQTTSSVWR